MPIAHQRLKRIALSGFILITMLMVQSQTAQAQQFNFRNYSVGEGLAQSQVFALLEDSRGYVWMGTRGGGLSRFDGRSFVSYTVSDGLVNNFILSIYEDKDQNLWIGTDNGISRFDGTEFTNFRTITNNRPFSVSAITQDSSGTLWAGSNTGLYSLKEDQFVRVPLIAEETSTNISIVYCDAENQLWIGHDKGVSRLQGNDLTTYGSEAGLANTKVRAIHRDRSGTLWVGTFQGLHRLNGEQFERVGTEASVRQASVFDLLEDSRGLIWAATPDKGTLRWDPIQQEASFVTETEGLANNHVRCILEDSWNNLWFGTSGGGISRFAGQQFAHYTTRNGLDGNYIYSVMEDSRGRLWMGTNGLGVSRFEEGQAVRLGADSGFYDTKVKALFEDCDSRIWIGTEGKGLTMYDGKRFRTLTYYTGLAGNWIRGIAQDSDDNLWVATAEGGVSKLTPDREKTFAFEIRNFKLEDGLPKLRLNCLHLDSLQRVWVGMASGGLAYIHQDSVYPFPHNDSLSSVKIRSLREDRDGNLWVGTADGGVNRIRLYEQDLSVSVVDRTNGLASNNVYLLEIDRDQNVWVGSESGVDKLSFGPEGQLLEIKHYGKAEGFLGIETAQNAVCADLKGNLWFGTINGLTRYTPGNQDRNPVPPKLIISRIDLTYKDLRQTDYGSVVGAWNRLQDELVLPHYENRIGFEFIGINLRNPEGVRYQWKLEGLDESWSPVSAKSDVSYPNLPPGDYSFLLKAQNEDGVWTSEPLRIPWTITKPWWGTWTFRIGGSLALILLFGAIFRERLRRVKRQTEQERQTLQLERNLLQLEQKALRLQMNPHFIFNSLNSIQGLIARKDDKTARFYLAKFSKLMRQILENSREGMVPLEEEITILENYLLLEQFSRNNNFEFHIRMAPEIQAKDFSMPPMLIQPFLENAIIHGVGHLTERGLIEVDFYLEGDSLVCSISDNGVGREKAANIRSQQDHQHKSTALQVTQERLDLLEGGNSQSSLQIEDLVAPDGTPAGTRVLIRIPSAASIA